MSLAVSDVYAVLVNWNGGSRNLESIKSLLDAGLPPAQVVFVDNGSSDGSLELVRREHSELLFLENASNEGFAAASSAGSVLALDEGAGAVFFVNNDVTLLDDCLERLAAALSEEPRVGIVGPRVLFQRERSKVWCAGGRVTWCSNILSLVGHCEDDAPEWELEREVDFVAGCAMLVRRELLEQVGCFAPEWFAYFEDADLCLRARQEGWSSRVVGKAACLHDASASTGGGLSPRRKYMMGVNSVWFLRAYGTPSCWIRFILLDVLSLPIALLLGLVNGGAKGALAKALGVLEGFSGRRVTAERIEPGAGPLW
jgi:GT2 family glycosyltransferase